MSDLMPHPHVDQTQLMLISFFDKVRPLEGLKDDTMEHSKANWIVKLARLTLLIHLQGGEKKINRPIPVDDIRRKRRCRENSCERFLSAVVKRSGADFSYVKHSCNYAKWILTAKQKDGLLQRPTV